MKVLRLVSLTLVILMLLPVMFACAESSSGGKETGKESSFESTSVKDPTEDEFGRPIVESSIPAGTKLNGTTITALVRDDPGYKMDFYTEGFTSDIVSNAIYQRELDSESILDYKFEVLLLPPGVDSAIAISDFIIKDQSAGTAAYDIGCIYGTVHMPLALEGYFENLYVLEEFDFSKPWWSDEYINENVVYNKLYGVVNDINICGSLNISAVFFNPKAAADHQITSEELFRHVYDGTWTLDVFMAYCKNIYVDLGGDGRDNNDFYGLLATKSNVSLDCWTPALDIQTITKDESGTPQLSFYSERTETIYSTLYDFYIGSDGVLFAEDDGDFDMLDAFINNQGVFMINMLYAVEYTRAMDSYGLLPIPKYSEAQDKYYTNIGTAINTMVISAHTPRIHEAALVLEHHSELTYRNVRPVVFEKAMKYKYLHESDSGKMFDYIVDGIRADFGVTYTLTINGGEYSMDNYSTLIRNKLRMEKSNLWNSYKRWEARYQKGLDNLITFFQKNSAN